MAQLCNHMRVYPCEKCTDEILEKKDVKITTLTERAEKAEQALVEERAMHKKAEDNLWARIRELEEERNLFIEGAHESAIRREWLWQQLILTESRLALLEKVAEAYHEGHRHGPSGRRLIMGECQCEGCALFAALKEGK